MAPLLNAKGRPVKMSFLDLFAPSTPSRHGAGTPRLERKKPKTEVSPPSTQTSPQSTGATASTEPTVATESGSAAWKRLEELALLGMKAQNMNWKEIGEALPGKDMDDIKKKYRELYVDAPASVKPKEGEVKTEEAKKDEEKKEEETQEAKTDEAKAGEESKKEKPEDKKPKKDSKQSKKSQKESKAQKGKGKTEDAKPEEVEPEEAKPEETKGILKAKATAEEKGKGGELKSINGHPVIFVDDDEEINFDELLYLFALNARYDQMKWIDIDSKFFDRFGKRVGAEKLKEKLAGI